MKIVNNPIEIDGHRVVQMGEEIAKAMENGETVYHWELGDSMDPIIRNAEFCMISPVTNIDDIKVGDAVFCKISNGYGGDYYMVHQVVCISNSGHDGKKWFKIGSTGDHIFGWTQDILGIAVGTDIFQCEEVCEQVIAEYERARLGFVESNEFEEVGN